MIECDVRLVVATRGEHMQCGHATLVGSTLSLGMVLGNEGKPQGDQRCQRVTMLPGACASLRMSAGQAWP